MRTIIFIIAIVILLGGCTFAPLAKPDSGNAGENQASLMLSEAQEVPPIVVEEREEPPEELNYHALDEHYQPETNLENQGQQRGYRVQVVTTEDPAEADRIIADIETKLEHPVYKVYEPPYYKVRVGNCTTHEEASELLDEIRKAGFDTFIVRDMINPADNEQ